jgi:hypothetical protein
VTNEHGAVLVTSKTGERMGGLVREKKLGPAAPLEFIQKNSNVFALI